MKVKDTRGRTVEVKRSGGYATINGEIARITNVDIDTLSITLMTEGSMVLLSGEEWLEIWNTGEYPRSQQGFLSAAWMMRQINEQKETRQLQRPSNWLYLAVEPMPCGMPDHKQHCTDKGLTRYFATTRLLGRSGSFIFMPVCQACRKRYEQKQGSENSPQSAS